MVTDLDEGGSIVRNQIKWSECQDWKRRERRHVIQRAGKGGTKNWTYEVPSAAKADHFRDCIADTSHPSKYRGEKKGLQILLSYSQAGPGRKAKQGQEEISRNHVPTFFLGSVCYLQCATARPSCVLSGAL